MANPQIERRPAIWPWLVMPLVTLVLFYSLDKLNREHQHRGAFGDPAQLQNAPDSSDTP